MFNLDALKETPKKEKASTKLSVKKLKYLKNPKKARFTEILVINSSFLFVFSSVFDRPLPTKKSTAELKAIKDKKRQSHHP
jgi:hypothetical protein